MRFLIDEDMPRSTGNLLRQYGHEAVDMRDIGLRENESKLSALYSEFAEEDQLLAEEGISEYAEMLRREDGQ